jgi:hypothetical protein
MIHAAVDGYRKAKQKAMSADDSLQVGLIVLRKAYVENMPAEFKSDPCPDERYSLANAERLFGGYVEKFEPHNLEFLYLEQSLGVPLGKVRGRDVILAGIVDATVKMQGLIFVNDIKTTAKPITQNYLDNFRLSQALMGYYYMSKKLMSEPIYGALIHAVWVQKEAKNSKAAKSLSEYFHAATYTYDDSQMDEWLENTLTTVDEILWAYETEKWPLNLGESCAMYNGCTYRGICWTTPAGRARVAEMDFEKWTWTPLEDVRSRRLEED